MVREKDRNEHERDKIIERKRDAERKSGINLKRYCEGMNSIGRVCDVYFYHASQTVILLKSSPNTNSHTT